MAITDAPRPAHPAVYLALIIPFGAAANLLAAIADDWRASANTVALVTGALGGIASAIGCFIGGYLCDRMDRRTVYWVFGLAQALCAVAMAVTPRTEPVYIVFVTLYWVITGFTYAAFSAVVLEAIGQGAAATKYNVFASLSNMPIAYMTLVDGWAHTRWGAGAMLHVEALIGVAAVALFIGVAACLRPTKTHASVAGLCRPVFPVGTPTLPCCPVTQRFRVGLRSRWRHAGPKRFAHRTRLLCGDQKKGARWTMWLAPRLFPVTQRSDAHAHEGRELLLRTGQAACGSRAVAIDVHGAARRVLAAVHLLRLHTRCA